MPAGAAAYDGERPIQRKPGLPISLGGTPDPTEAGIPGAMSGINGSTFISRDSRHRITRVYQELWGHAAARPHEREFEMQPDGPKQRWLRPAGLITIMLLLGMLVACGDGQEANTPEQTPTPRMVASGTTSAAAITPTVTTDIRAITDNPADYLGETVTVRGTLAEVLGPQVFRMEAPNGGGSDLLVVGAAEAIENVTTGDAVQVQGEVDQFDLVKIEEILSTDLEEELFDDMAGETTIIADAIMPAME